MFGFNEGRTLAVNSITANAFLTTNTAVAAGALFWMFSVWYHSKPRLLVIVSGAIAGMLAITPAAGFVTPIVSILIGGMSENTLLLNDALKSQEKM